MPQLLSIDANGLSFWIRAKPGTKKERGAKVVDVGDGKCAIEVSVAAVAVDGKANEALIERLAKEMGLKKRDLQIKTGTTGRLKRIVISALSAREKVEAWIALAETPSVEA